VPEFSLNSGKPEFLIDSNIQADRSAVQAKHGEGICVREAPWPKGGAKSGERSIDSESEHPRSACRRRTRLSSREKGSRNSNRERPGKESQAFVCGVKEGGREKKGSRSWRPGEVPSQLIPEVKGGKKKASW